MAKPIEPGTWVTCEDITHPRAPHQYRAYMPCLNPIEVFGAQRHTFDLQGALGSIPRKTGVLDERSPLPDKPRDFWCWVATFPTFPPENKAKVETNWFDDLKSGLQAWHIIHCLIGEMGNAPVGIDYQSLNRLQRSQATDMMISALAKVEVELLRKFSEPSPLHPDCIGCLRRSIFGGPDHQASVLCQSGKRPHCTCSACW